LSVKTKVRIFGESRLDFKYKKFLGNLSESYCLVTFSDVLKLTIQSLNKETKYFFHVRYLKWRGRFLTLPYYLLVVLICKLRGISLIYTCHNYWEHNFESRLLNNLIREFLIKYSNKIVVLDEDLGLKVHRGKQKVKERVRVVHFSDFSDFFDSQTEINEGFQIEYKNWLEENNIDRPDLLLISASYKSLDKFFPLFKNTLSNVLCIVPNVISTDQLEIYKHVLVYNKFVKKEVTDLLCTEGIIGMVGLDNGSIATSLYMFASYNIPCLVLDEPPMNRLIKEYGLGLTFDFDTPLDGLVDDLKTHYFTYVEGCKNLLKDHTWEKSYEIHREIFSI
jgi:hypothetical protein